MERDKELLELAAKAAGYDISHPWNAMRANLDPPVIGLCIDGVSTNWNPLTDDGDALRLAVKLKVGIGCIVGADAAVAYHFTESGMQRTEEQFDSDQYAATRRAIVRAAAEIGRNL